MLDCFVVGLYLLFTLGIGLYAAKGMKTVAEFSTGKRAYSKWIIFATLSSSFIGGGYAMGNAAKVFEFGIFQSTALLGFSLSQILIALFIAPKMHRFAGAISVGDIMETRFGISGKVVTGFCAFLFCSGIVGAQLKAIGYIFDHFMGISEFWGVIIASGIVIAYSSLGGIHSVIMANVFQFITLTMGIPLILGFGVYHAGGLGVVFEAIPSGHLDILGKGSDKHLSLLFLFGAFFFGEALIPPYLQRLLIGKDSGDTKAGTLYSGLYSIPFFFIVGSVGLVAYSLNPTLNPENSMLFVIDTAIPVGIKGLLIAAVISIVMSSADSYLNSASVSIVHDVITPLVRQKLSPSGSLLCVQITNCFVGVFAVSFALHLEGLLNMLLYVYKFWAPIILIPLLMVILNRPTSYLSFMLGIISGGLSTMVWTIYFEPQTQVNALLVGVATHFVVYVIVEGVNQVKIKAYQPS